MYYKIIIANKDASTRLLSVRIGDWPVYAFMMALGQILSVNSYQITLLTGEASQTSDKLYIIGSVYFATSIMWWLLIRNFKSLYSICIPWVFFGLAFFILGITGFISNTDTQNTVQLIATVMYTAGASSGAVMFALNFGDEGKLFSILFFLYQLWGTPTNAYQLRWLSDKTMGHSRHHRRRYCTGLLSHALVLGLPRR